MVILANLYIAMLLKGLRLENEEDLLYITHSNGLSDASLEDAEYACGVVLVLISTLLPLSTAVIGVLVDLDASRSTVLYVKLPLPTPTDTDSRALTDACGVQQAPARRIRTVLLTTDESGRPPEEPRRRSVAGDFAPSGMDSLPCAAYYKKVVPCVATCRCARPRLARSSSSTAIGGRPPAARRLCFGRCP